MPLVPIWEPALESISSTDTLDDTNDIVLCSNSSDITINLPSAANRKRPYTIKKTGANNNTVTIDPASTEQIDGQTTIVLYVIYESITIMPVGPTWVIISDDRIPHAAKMTRTTTQSIPSSSLTKIQLTTAEIDNAGITDVATDYDITIKRAGIYKITGYCSLASGLDDGEYGQVQIAIDGTEIVTHYDYSSQANGFISVGVTTILSLTAGQTVDLRMLQNEGSNLNTETGTAKPRLEVCEIQ